MANGVGNLTDSTREMANNALGLHDLKANTKGGKRQGKCERGSTSDEGTLALRLGWQIGNWSSEGGGICSFGECLGLDPWLEVSLAVHGCDDNQILVRIP